MLKRFEELNRTIRNLHTVTGLLQSMGANTESVFDIEDNYRGSEQIKACLERVRAIPEALELMESRYLGPGIDLDQLSKLPKGTLGYNYATIMKTLNFDPDFYRIREISSDEDWLTMRMRKTHDIIHVISGFGPSGGELGVLSIQAVQIGYPVSIFLQTASLAMALKFRPEILPGITSQIARGMSMGLQIKPLIAQRWEEGWDKPVKQWRQELNLTNPVIDEPYSMKNRLSQLDLDW